MSKSWVTITPHTSVIYDPERHRRQSIRLRGYDYTQAGAYFVTISTMNRTCLFGEVVNGEMRLNDPGWVAQAAWDDLPTHYPYIALDAVVFMPNHVHGIIVLTDTPVGAGLKPAPTIPTIRRGLPEIIRAFKTFSARRINLLRGTTGTAVWQRNYYEHIIRNDDSLDHIRRYLLDNPARWSFDRENP